MDITTLQHRGQLGQWLNDNGLVGVGVEVGVLSGGNARQIMSTWQGQLLHLVDPWEKVDPKIYRETQGWPVDECYKECQKLAAEYPGRIMLHKAYSPDITVDFWDDTLDWVYLDGNHSYEAVSSDIRAWWPKVKSGGLLCGHDFYREHTDGKCCDVEPAVLDWCSEVGIKEPYVTRYPECWSWWIEKQYVS